MKSLSATPVTSPPLPVPRPGSRAADRPPRSAATFFKSRPIRTKVALTHCCLRLPDNDSSHSERKRRRFDACDRPRADAAGTHQPGAARSRGGSRTLRHRSQRGPGSQHDLGRLEAAACDERDAALGRAGAQPGHDQSRLFRARHARGRDGVPAHCQCRLQRNRRGREHRVPLHQRRRHQPAGAPAASGSLR